MFMHCWVNQRLRYILSKNAVNQALQCTRKKPLTDWLIRNQWWLRRQTNSNLDSNQGLRISRTYDRMNDHVDERTNKLSEFSAGVKTTYMQTRVSSWYIPNWRQRNDTSQTHWHHRDPKFQLSTHDTILIHGAFAQWLLYCSINEDSIHVFSQERSLADFQKG